MAVAASEARAEVGVEPAASTPAREPGTTKTRLGRFVADSVGVLAYATVLTMWIIAKGVPLTRGAIALWLMAAMVAFSLRDVRRWATGIALEWFPFIAFLFAYDTARSFANRLFETN